MGAFLHHIAHHVLVCCYPGKSQFSTVLLLISEGRSAGSVRLAYFIRVLKVIFILPLHNVVIVMKMVAVNIFDVACCVRLTIYLVIRYIWGVNNSSVYY